MKKDFLLLGVGGQGIILAGDVLAAVGLRLGYDVKKAEVHGMAQRGGAVESVVRWGEQVYSPLLEEADVLLGLEELEGARGARLLRPGGLALLNRQRIRPLAVALGRQPYPEREAIAELFAGRELHWVEATASARELGNIALASAVMLGALAARLDGDAAVWREALLERVPAKYTSLNEQAFERGFKTAEA